MEDFAYYMFWTGLIATAVASAGYVVHAFGLRMGYSMAAATGAGNVVVGNGQAAVALAGRVGTLFTWLAVLFLTTSLAARWSAAGRPPVSNMWEYTVGFGWGIALLYALFERHYVGRSDGRGSPRTLGAFVMPVSLGLLAISEAFFPSSIKPLVPALQENRLLAAHVGTTMVAYSALSVSFGAGVMYLIQGENRRFSQLPTQDALEAIGYGSVLVGFPLLALGIALGAYWANSAWGRYWGWDPKETSALVTWLIYAGYLHARGLGGWRGNRSAWLLILGFAAVLFTFFAVNLWVSGLHSYAGV
jgi:cytochrome c-type biogenesis protein CcsB